MNEPLEQMLKRIAERVAGMTDRPGIPEAGEEIARRIREFGSVSRRAADSLAETDAVSGGEIWRRAAQLADGGGSHWSGNTGPRPAGSASDPIDDVVANRRPVDWNAVVGENRVILLGEAHSNVAIRSFLAAQARSMREAGITHYGIEAPPHPAFDELNAGRMVDLTGVSVGPGFPGYEQTIRAMRNAGITVVPLDLDQSLPLAADARDRHMADTITQIVSQDPDAKVVALLGRFHSGNSQRDFGPTAGALLHAGPHPTTSISFTGGSETSNMLTEAAREHNATYETFFVDLRDYHAAGGGYGRDDDAFIHLPQYA